MLLRTWVSRFLGYALLIALTVAAVTIALQPDLWWLLLLFLGMFWLYGYLFSHAYILAHGIGPRRP
jgi:4-hydroxybenzoate polyprenyltransferase